MKRKRAARAKNKIQGSSPETTLVPTGPALHSEAPGMRLRSRPIAVARSTLFNAELEQAIEIIARERVRAMLAGRTRLLYMAPLTVVTATNLDDASRR